MARITLLVDILEVKENGSKELLDQQIATHEIPYWEADGPHIDRRKIFEEIAGEAKLSLVKDFRTANHVSDGDIRAEIRQFQITP